MQVPIAQLATGLVGSLFGGGRQASRGDEATSTRTAESAGPSSAISPAQYRQILAEFDVRKISPRQFSQLIGELQATGELEPADVQQLQAIRLQLDAENASPDEPIDLLGWIRGRLAQAGRVTAADAATGDTTQELTRKLAALEKQAGWVERLDRAHQAALEGPLDMVA